MQINAQEIEATKLELELYLESDEADYDLYLEGVTQVCQLTLLDIVQVEKYQSMPDIFTIRTLFFPRKSMQHLLQRQRL